MRNLRYCPELNTITGSITASLVMCQLEYWFKKTDYKPFYKFLGPCEDMHYHTGDSWTEELGFTKAEFRTAFHKIGKAYKTKTAYRKSTDPFEGKLYLSYYDRIRKLTYYIRNDALVDELLTNHHCESAYSEDYLSSQITPIHLDKTKSSTIASYSPKLQNANCIPTPYVQIVDLFNRCCPSLRKMAHLTDSCKLKLDTLYHKLLDKGEDVLASLERAFTLAEQSDFLCGRTPKNNWKAAFGWIIRIDKFFAILKGDYTTYSPTCIDTTPAHQSSACIDPKLTDQAPTYKSRTTVSKFLRMYTHGFNIKELEAREQAYLDSLYGSL